MLLTLNVLPNGISMKPPVASIMVARNVRRYRPWLTVATRCRSGLRVDRTFRCSTIGCRRAAITTPTGAPTTRIMMNAACQPQRFDRNTPSGNPSTWLAANAVWIVPITRPRISSGNRSATMAMTIEPMTPPKMPVTIRAPTRNVYVSATPHNNVPIRKPP